MQGKFILALLEKKKLMPHCVLKVHAPAAESSNSRYKHDFDAIIIRWQHEKLRYSGLTLYNNHKDEKATFDHFANDGASTSRSNRYAVGFMGKGFILATQYMVEQCGAFDHSGASLRVASKAGYTKWEKRMLKFIMYDYRLLTPASLRAECKCTGGRTRGKWTCLLTCA